jgi:phospholipid/cholesterol/gamma-HCH transport system ATP-binding protein
MNERQGPPRSPCAASRKPSAQASCWTGVDLDVGAGESLVVIGGSGTGKSVLVKCILGLMEPDAGSIIRSTARK